MSTEYTDKTSPPQHALIYEFYFGENAFTTDKNGNSIEIPQTDTSFVVCYPKWIQDPEFHWVGQWEANSDKRIEEFYHKEEAQKFALTVKVTEKDLEYEDPSWD